MFSSALKSISPSNINSNYSVSQNPASAAGPWKIYDAKKKATGKSYSVFVFDKKSLDSHGSSVGRSGASSFKRSVDEVVERLKKEASSLAKLRHPSILELVEPVEETRGGGLQFVTEAVTASLAGLLQEKDDQERTGGRSSRYVTEDADGVRRRREIEIDELEIQKGLLQISKALEFLHENAGLVHGNLTPDAVLINAKSDWKISGLAFCSPAEGSGKPTSIHGISLSEVLNLDPRIPKTVQLNLDYTSPDFVMDNNLTPSADMFSLGVLCVALYNSPHRSPLECHGSTSTYKRTFSSSSTVPTSSNNFLSSRPIPKDLAQHVLPKLITRRPAQRLTAKEFQESEYFDNVLVSTIRFLDSFPAKTPNEKAAFLRGLVKVLPSFPKSVMEKKLLPALLEEMKDKDLLSPILQNVFKIVSLLPSARRAFGEKIRPALKVVFVENAKQNQEKDPARDAGLMVFLEQISVVADNCNGKEFKDVLDFSTIKNELFPVVAAVFSKTSSLAIKVRGLQAFVVLCGGSLSSGLEDGSGLDGLVAENKKSSSSSALDKYTMQERIVPLIKAIKTKEPAVMMAARDLMYIIGQTADAEFVAMDLLPILWNMSLGPLLNLKQFQAFMNLIKTLSKRVEEEQTRKLQELTGTSSSSGPAAAGDDFLAFGGVTGTAFDANGANEDDFEALVKGKTSPSSGSNGVGVGVGVGVGNGHGHSNGNITSPWVDSPRSTPKPLAPSAIAPAPSPSFSWSTQPAAAQAAGSTSPAKPKPQPQPQPFRTVSPDAPRFEPLTPSSTQFSRPLQPSTLASTAPPTQGSTSPPSSINWSSATPAAAAAKTGFSPPPAAPSYTSLGALSPPRGAPGPAVAGSSQFSLAPPPGSTTTASTSSSTAPSGMGFSLAPPPSAPRQTAWTSPPSTGLGAMSGASGSIVGTSTNAGMSTHRAASNNMGMGMGMAPSTNMNTNMNRNMNGGMGTAMWQLGSNTTSSSQAKSGLDKYESLI
ncbi:Protein kinase-like protein SCY1 [Escovopsis weberi]|uniref:Protein kinase-like protein SCY1 n=1 Tax=Escovopsis weberi TaxID=150374 RepID=A0A0M9VXH8_ESCWE|nr:Protein kinase-like protein SCY1 [Escovopsis weberi]